MSTIVYMSELVSIEAIKELVEYKMKREIEVVRSTDSASKFSAFVAKGANIGLLTLEDYGLTAIGEDGNDKSSYVYCIIFDDELRDGQLNIQGVLDDVLVINNTPVTSADMKVLLDFNKALKVG